MTPHPSPARKFIKAIALTVAALALALGGTAAASDSGTPIPVAGPPTCC